MHLLPLAMTMERDVVTRNKKSFIINNPNDWGREHRNPAYILNLLLPVINVSVRPVEIINGLSALKTPKSRGRLKNIAHDSF